MSLTGIPEEQVKESLAKFNRLVDNLNAAIDQTEIRGLIVTANETITTIHCISKNLLEITEKLKAALK